MGAVINRDGFARAIVAASAVSIAIGSFWGTGHATVRAATPGDAESTRPSPASKSQNPPNQGEYLLAHKSKLLRRKVRSREVNLSFAFATV